MIYPLPAVLVTCGTMERSNMLTIAWTGTICTNPAMCYISVRPERYSYPMIKERMEFTINLTTAAMARATDWAGVRSGADYHSYDIPALRSLAIHIRKRIGAASEGVGIALEISEIFHFRIFPSEKRLSL